MRRLPKIKKDRGYFLRMFQAQFDWTNAQAAEHFGIGQSQWSLLRDMKRNASPALAERIAAETGADFKDLLMGAK